MREQLIIRADATARQGIGHLMRCLALAQGWQDRGGWVALVTCCNNEQLLKRIRQEGMRVKILDHPHPEPVDLEQTLEYLASVRSKDLAHPIWVALDGYHFDPEYQSAIRDLDVRLLVIDDMGHYPLYHADILLNPNIHATALTYNFTKNAQVLAGPRYALLRREFLASQTQNPPVADLARRILITMGGADPDSVTLKVIEALAAVDVTDMEVRIIVGPSNPQRPTIARASGKSPFNVQIIESPIDMPEQMRWADVAVTGGGGTCLELALMGVPFIILILAENQLLCAEGFEKEELAINLGWHTDVTPQDLAHALDEFLRNRDKREIMSSRGQASLDGRSVARVLETMAPTALELRRATTDDCHLIWQWTNDPVTRSASFSSAPIPFDEHRSWFLARIHSPQYAFYVGTNQHGRPVGFIRFELSDGTASVSVNLGPEYRSIGLGSRLIRLASEKVHRDKNLENIFAYIKYENTASIAAFTNAGYQLHGQELHKGFQAVRMIYGKESGK